MKTMLKALEDLYHGNALTEEDEYDKKLYFSERDGFVLELQSMCCEFLICDDGTCNWNNINILRRNGYRVFSGERDSFGWLTGCIQKRGDKRILVYG